MLVSGPSPSGKQDETTLLWRIKGFNKHSQRERSGGFSLLQRLCHKFWVLWTILRLAARGAFTPTSPSCCSETHVQINSQLRKLQGQFWRCTHKHVCVFTEVCRYIPTQNGILKCNCYVDKGEKRKILWLPNQFGALEWENNCNHIHKFKQHVSGVIPWL